MPLFKSVLLSLYYAIPRQFYVMDRCRVYRSNVLSVLLYGAVTWRITKSIGHSLEVFQNRCLCRLFNIYWPNKISNEDLLKKAQKQTLTSEIQRRRWRWLGHVLRMPPNAAPRVALRWTPDGK